MRNALHGIAFLTLGTLMTSVFAEEVTGRYEGTITTDSGLGLNGQPMVFAYTYEDSTTGTASGAATFFTGPVTAGIGSIDALFRRCAEYPLVVRRP